MSNRRISYFIISGCAATLACLFIFSAVMGQAQTDSEKKKATLELKLSVPMTTFCAGTSIDLDLDIKNFSQEVVKIDKADLWLHYRYAQSKPDGGGHGGGESSSCDHCNEDFLVLYPGDSFWGSHKFSLHSEFFREVGKYRIGTSTDKFESNQVDFEIINCGNN